MQWAADSGAMKRTKNAFLAPPLSTTKGRCLLLQTDRVGATGVCAVCVLACVRALRASQVPD